jgi:hypothetical protein
VAVEPERYLRAKATAVSARSAVRITIVDGTAGAISLPDAGFEIESCDRFLFQPCLMAKLVAPHILGRARRPVADQR